MSDLGHTRKRDKKSKKEKKHKKEVSDSEEEIITNI